MKMEKSSEIRPPMPYRMGCLHDQIPWTVKHEASHKKKVFAIRKIGSLFATGILKHCRSKTCVKRHINELLMNNDKALLFCWVMRRWCTIDNSLDTKRSCFPSHHLFYFWAFWRSKKCARFLWHATACCAKNTHSVCSQQPPNLKTCHNLPPEDLFDHNMLATSHPNLFRFNQITGSMNSRFGYGLLPLRFFPKVKIHLAPKKPNIVWCARFSRCSTTLLHFSPEMSERSTCPIWT